MTIARPALLAMLVGCASITHADEQQVVTIEGVVYAAIPCVINNNTPISGPFGDVQTAGIDGTYKTITLEYALDCSRSATNELRMQVRGSSTSFNPTLLVVPGYANLGVALKKDDSTFALNSWMDFNANKTPVLKAVLVKRSKDSAVEAGDFNTSATLVVDYR